MWTLLLLLAAAPATRQSARPAEQAHSALEQPASETANEIDFARDIAPLIERHCLRCHSDQRKMGGLSLASREQAVKGGQSGQNVLAPGDRNELLRRLHADNPEERMPLEGSALSAAQIDLLARWIAAGAPWPKAAPPPSPPPPPAEPKSLLEYVGVWIDLWDRWHLDRLRPAGYGLLAVLMAMLVIERLKQHFAKSAVPPTGLAGYLSRVPRLAYAVAVLALVGYGLAVYTWGMARDLAMTQDLLQGVQKELQKSQGQGATPYSYAHNEIYWPQHPPRLGGTYYRGNDERNPALFNGGVYRTVTFDLELRDSGDRVLQIGDRAEGPLTVRLQFRKAPHTTPLLFSESTIGPACLSFIPPQPQPAKAEDAPAKAEDASAKASPAASNAPAKADDGPQEDIVPGPITGGPYPSQVVEPDECWEFSAPLPALPAGKPLVGMIYLYPQLKERPDDDAQQPHYAIAYRLQLDEDQRLTRDSTLHLGSMYHTSTVLQIPTGRIAPSDWFDYRPLPEIEGGNSTDPKLLGVEAEATTADTSPAARDQPEDQPPPAAPPDG